MTKCEKMEQFINDHTDITMKYMMWEDTILKQNNNKDDSTDITDIDFDIVS